MIFTKHEEEGAFAVEMVLRNFAPVPAFVVRWDWPMFRREGGLDPSRLKSAAGRPTKHRSDDLLELLGTQRLKTSQWFRRAKEELGVSNGSFFAILKQLETDQKVQKSPIDEKWELLQNYSKNQNREKDQ